MRLGSALRQRTRPTLTNQSYEWVADTPLDILGDATAGDFPLRAVEIVTPPAFGTATVLRTPASAVGNVLFTPPAGAPQEWETTFTCRVRDTGGLPSGVATITVGLDPGTPDPTYPNGYDRRVELWVNARPAPNATLTNFLALVEVTIEGLRTVANGGFVTDAAGDDIRPELPDGTALDYWIDTYAPTTGYMLAHVLLPSWNTAAALNFYLYYGNSSQTTPEGNSNDALSSVAYAWDCRTGADLKGGVGIIEMGSVGAGTLVGDAGSYDGLNSFGRRTYASGGLSGLAAMTAMTVRAVVKSDVVGGRHGIIMQGPSGGIDETSSLILAYVQATWAGATNAIQFQWRNASGSNYVVSPAGKHTTERQVIHATWANGAAPSLYIDGVLQTPAASGFNAGATVTPNGDMWLGVAPNVPAPHSTGWDGLIDEVRILPTVMSAAHVAAEAANIASPSTFISIGTPTDPTEPDLPPVAIADAVNCPHETAVLISVLANDSDPNGLTLSIDSVTTPSPSGTAEIVGTQVRYTPIADFSGVATFQYTVENTAELQATATVTVTVAAASSVNWAGPRSHLPFYSGGYYRNDLLELLRTNPVGGKVRKMDCILTFWQRSGWQQAGTTAANVWKSADAAGRWGNYIAANPDLPAIAIAIQPWCSVPANGGNQNNILSAWPSTLQAARSGGITRDHWIAPNRPVAFVTGASDAEMREKALEVWKRARDGWFDHIWEEIAEEIRVAIPLLSSGIRVLWRPWWENNNFPGSGNIRGCWGSTDQYTCATATFALGAAGSSDIVAAGMRRWCDIFKAKFPNSYFWWAPTRGQYTAAGVWGVSGLEGGTMSVVNPLYWDLIGPDFYDRDDVQGAGETSQTKNTWPYPAGNSGGPNNFPRSRGSTQAPYTTRWQQIAYAGTQASPIGIVRWFEWLENVALPINPNVRMGIGEWGCWSYDSDNQSANRLPTAGHDNALYNANMFDLMMAKAAFMGCELYYNNRRSDGLEDTLVNVAGGNPVTVLPNASAMITTKYGTRT